MKSDSVADWIDTLWPLVCARAARPVGGVLLDRAASGELAEEAFTELLGCSEAPPRTWESILRWLTTHVAPRALHWVSEKRKETKNPDFARDPSKKTWERNPNFSALLARDASGSLKSREWGSAEPILWNRVSPIFPKMGLQEEDGRDVYMECLAELLQARTDAGPLEQMHVFEELPRFFSTMVERRSISWLRKQSARKRQANNPNLAVPLDDPDSLVRHVLADPRSVSTDPWSTVGFDRIHAACQTALSDFEWHLINALFVEGSHTRIDLASDVWVLEQLGIKESASESKRRRYLNSVIEEALGRLGRALESVDL